MKRVLIISPHFPPVNAADMQRVRQSLPYFKEFGWEPVIVTVDESDVESYSIDPLLMHTVPSDIEVHKVRAWDVRKTRKFGLGSLSMRSYFHFLKMGDQLLAGRPFDLVYFSTTAFHVMALGPRWKKKFGVPFILDIQDPWRNDFYLDKPGNERPPKFFISYNIDKYLEARTVPLADGIISVSQGYCDTFIRRYPGMKKGRFRVIPFGASGYDFEVMEKYVDRVGRVPLESDKINIVYIGRGGHDMRFALEIIFRAFAKGLTENFSMFSRARLWFVGTSYAPAGTGEQTVRPLAESLGLGEYVTEITDRIPYFDGLFLLKKATLLLVPGSTDTSYTASKIYSCIMAEKPLLAVFYKTSSVVDALRALQYGRVITFDHFADTPESYADECLAAFENLLTAGGSRTPYDKKVFEPFTARAKTIEQVDFFNMITGEIAKKSTQ
ncbi:MAG: glycosyltransferase [Puia sp.]|nr:glycosyltransferase [Puia sp.]